MSIPALYQRPVHRAVLEPWLESRSQKSSVQNRGRRLSHAVSMIALALSGHWITADKLHKKSKSIKWPECNWWWRDDDEFLQINEHKPPNSESYFTSHSTFSIINKSKLNRTHCGRQLQTTTYFGYVDACQQWYTHLDSIINLVIIIHMYMLTYRDKYKYQLHSEPTNSIFYTIWRNVFYIRSKTGANGHLKITSVQFTDNVCSWHFIIYNLRQGRDTNLSKT